MNSHQRRQSRRMLQRLLAGEWPTAKRGTRKATLIKRVIASLDTRISLTKAPALQVIETDQSRLKRLEREAKRNLDRLKVRPPTETAPSLWQTIIDFCARFVRGEKSPMRQQAT